MQQKTLTVVIPTYNMEKYLRRCLDSLIVGEEQMAQLEVLVVNDGSKDTSSAIAHEYEKKYPGTFRVIDKENGHYGSCVNRGLKEATGKYIKILDADDWYDTKNFEKYIDIVKDLDVDLVLNDFVRITPDGTIRDKDTVDAEGYKVFDFFKSNATRQVMQYIAYKTENVRRINYHQTEGVSFSDSQWAFIPLCSVKTAYYIPLVIYMYLVGREGQSMSMAIRKRVSDKLKVKTDELRVFTGMELEKDIYVIQRDRLLESVNAVYKDVLFLCHEKEGELKAFDAMFKENYPALYEESGSIMMLSHKIPYKYLPYWRKHGRLNNWSIFVWLYRLFIYNQKMKYDRTYKSKKG